MLWFCYQSADAKSVLYVNLAHYLAKFKPDGTALLYSENYPESEVLNVNRPEDVARLRKLLDQEIRLQRLIVPPEAE